LSVSAVFIVFQMGQTYLVYLPGENIWTCKCCGAHLVDNSEMHSANYHGSSGDAYLFPGAVNTSRGKVRVEKLRSGIYRISDIHCISCHHRLGWIYEISFSEEQKYKEGKIVLEKAFIHCSFSQKQDETSSSPYE